MNSQQRDIYLVHLPVFPTGAAEFVEPRQRCVTVGNYYKHRCYTMI